MGYEVRGRLWNSELVAEFTPAAMVSPWGPCRALDLLQGAHAFEYEFGFQRALFAVRKTDMLDGPRAEVLAMVSTGQRLQANDFCEVLDFVALRMGVSTMAFTTPHRHMVDAGLRNGWKNTGQIMIKTLGPLQ